MFNNLKFYFPLSQLVYKFKLKVSKNHEFLTQCFDHYLDEKK